MVTKENVKFGKIERYRKLDFKNLTLFLHYILFFRSFVSSSLFVNKIKLKIEKKKKLIN